MDVEPLETAEAQDTPTVRQLSVFLENRVGQLLRLAQLFTDTNIRILAVSIVNSVDCAVCRLIVDEPDRATDILRDARFQVSEAELLVVSLPHGRRGLLHTWATLLGGEVSVNYTYPLLTQPRGASALAVCVDSLHQAVEVLHERGFEVLDEEDLLEGRVE